ncbi:alpha-1A adrenergic receptor-like [Paramacrobiotus metropolitanus]|uniref:alpha-1A adrenergic receptor-like n=1 Tax=Paramacrobiotus metropolitanus TaxID=2943436 RepID=UPI002445BEE5|nr:alpha-1A adrenergic receptor-like [Paramacrobiotus metropolitanus]
MAFLGLTLVIQVVQPCDYLRYVKGSGPHKRRNINIHRPPTLPASHPPGLPPSRPPTLPASHPPGLPPSRPPTLPASDPPSPHACSRILILHQLITESQITLFYWPVNYVLLPVLHPSFVTITDKFCHHFQYGFAVTLGATWYGLAVLALNRFVAVVWPFKYQYWITKPLIAIQMIIPWAMGIVVVIRFYLMKGGFPFSAKSRICDIKTDDEAFQITSVFGLFLPLLLSCVFYVGLFIGFRINRKRQTVGLIPQASGSISDHKSRTTMHSNAVVVENFRKSKRRLNLAKGLFVVSVIHLVGFASDPVFLAAVPEGQDRYPYVRQWILLLFYVGYLSTPVIITITNQDAKALARKIFRAAGCR